MEQGLSTVERRIEIRWADLDSSRHVNNAVYWQAVEELLPALGVDPRLAFRAELDYRQPIDFDESIELAAFDDAGRSALAFIAGGDAVRAVARLGPPP